MDDKDKELWIELTTMTSQNLLDEFEKTIRFFHYDYNMEPPKYSLDMLRTCILDGLENAH